jgi:hypothetical protein
MEASGNAIQEIEQIWEKNAIFDFFNLRAKLYYGIFTKKVLQLKEKGNQIIESYQREVDRKNVCNASTIVEAYGDNELSSRSSPTLIISKEKNKLNIANCNNQFSSLLGYQRSALTGKLLTKIIPKFNANFYKEKFNFHKTNENFNHHMSQWDEATFVKGFLFRKLNLSVSTNMRLFCLFHRK